MFLISNSWFLWIFSYLNALLFFNNYAYILFYTFLLFFCLFFFKIFYENMKNDEELDLNDGVENE
jgi:hypothetical protein